MSTLKERKERGEVEEVLALHGGSLEGGLLGGGTFAASVAHLCANAEVDENREKRENAGYEVVEGWDNVV